MTEGTWQLWAAGFMAGGALVLLYRIASGIDTLAEQVKQLRSEVAAAALPGGTSGSRDSNVARLLEGLYRVQTTWEEMRNHQIDGPFRPSQPP